MHSLSLRRLARSAAFLVTVAALLGSALPVSAYHVTGGGSSFTFLQLGFTQDVFGVSDTFMGGVAFAPDGDPWVDECAFGGSPLHRYNAQSTPPPVNGTSLHTESIVASGAGCGLANHSNGSLYTNTSSGVVRLDANTGAVIGGPFGPAGNALGIAEDPETGNLIYVGSGGTLSFVNPALTVTGTFSTATTGNFLDGIAFDPTGNFLFASNRSAPNRLTILDGDTGAFIQDVVVAHEPDGIAFHATAPKFVITDSTDGTITRYDFPGDNYSLPPLQSLFASGGFRGDLSQVGPDGCVYVTQAGTRYNDGTVTGQNSLVRICGGFAPTPGVRGNITLTPVDDTNPVGTNHTVTAHVTDANGAPLQGEVVTFAVTGQNGGATGVCVPAGCITDANGEVTFTYNDSNGAGDDTITASFTDSTGRLQSATAQKHWLGDEPITATGVAIAATEGTLFNGTVATFTDPDTTATAAEYRATINWGDGTPLSAGTVSGSGGNFTVSGSHIYAEEGSFTVTVVITDVDNTSNTATATSTASVADAALSSRCAMVPFTGQAYAGPTATFTDASSTGTLDDFSATINWGDTTSSAGTIVGGPGPAPYTVSGSHTYTSTGPFTVTTTINDVGGSNTTATCNPTVFAFAPGGGSFAIGDTKSAVGTPVLFWGAQWAKKNPVSSGTTVPAFKGFALNPTVPSCGATWSTDPGNSTPPPAGPLPAYMGVIVTSRYSKSGSTISGDILHIVVVRTDPGYEPNPGHAGTGTVVGQVC